MNSSRLLLIRHAETDLAGTFCGSSDPAVNASGDLQIATLLQTLGAMSDEPPEVVYSSDLRRALSTAQRIATHFSARLCIDPHLREIDFGRWEALRWEQIEQLDPILSQQWLARYPNQPAPSGEPMDSFEDRVLHAFDTIASLHERSVVVTHAGVLRVILTRRCSLTDEAAWLQTKQYCSFLHYPLREVLHDGE